MSYVNDAMEQSINERDWNPKTSPALAQKPRLLGVMGARPNFIKMQALWPCLKAYQELNCTLLHTNQHYDSLLSDQYLQASGLVPDLFLPKTQNAHSEERFIEIMRNFKNVIDACVPNVVLVIGDVDSTLACALTAARQNIPVIHVEAGLRCFDKTVPEERNRILVDHLSSLLFTTEPAANDNLLREGISQNRIHWVGNVLIDALIQALPQKMSFEELKKIVHPSLKQQEFLLVTLHRRGLLESDQNFLDCLEQINLLSNYMPVVWPIHPHTKKRLLELTGSFYCEREKIHLVESFQYEAMLAAMYNSKAVITDSGGLQEETTYLNIPCFTVRPNTERPVTLQWGSNTLVPNIHDLNELVLSKLQNSQKNHFSVALWDGQAGSRIAKIIVSWLGRIP